MLRRWTIGRASGIGGTAALLALLLWPIHARLGGALFWPFGFAAAVAGACGASILLITAGDLLFHRRRGASIRPVRGFDIAFGTVLLSLSLFQLHELAGGLPA